VQLLNKTPTRTPKPLGQPPPPTAHRPPPTTPRATTTRASSSMRGSLSVGGRAGPCQVPSAKCQDHGPEVSLAQARTSPTGGALPNSNSLGCSLDPFQFASAIRCHQKSTCNSAGSSVGSLAPPRGHPTARRCGRVVPALPLLLCTRPARARPSVGGQSPPPAPRLLPWGPPRGWCSRRLPYSNSAGLLIKAYA
jgi:hypothetical protein